MTWLCLALLLVALAISLPLTGVMRRVSVRLGALDPAGVAGQVKHEHRRIPNTGGVAIYLAIAVPMALGLAGAWLAGDALADRLPALAPHLPGIRAHEQAPSLLPLWEPLAEQLRALDHNGQDVIVDAGRLGLTGWAQPLVAASDLTLLVTRSSLPALAGATSWAKTLRGQFARETNESKKKELAEAIQVRAFEIGTHAPLGEYVNPLAARKNIAGWVIGSGDVYWNVKKN